MFDHSLFCDIHIRIKANLTLKSKHTLQGACKTANMSIGKRIKNLRTERKLSAQQIAQAAGVTRQAVYQWESGDSKTLKSENLVAIAKVLGTTAEALSAGKMPTQAEMLKSDYIVAPSEEALEVARAWQLLPISKRMIYRDCILRDAAILTVLPWLDKMSEPSAKSYQAIMESIQNDYEQHIKQLNLDL